MRHPMSQTNLFIILPHQTEDYSLIALSFPTSNKAVPSLQYMKRSSLHMIFKLLIARFHLHRSVDFCTNEELHTDRAVNREKQWEE